MVLVDGELAVHYMNPAAENLFEASSKNMAGLALGKLLPDAGLLDTAIAHARTSNSSYTEHDLELRVGNHSRLHVSCTVTPLDLPDSDLPDDMVLLEFRQIEQQMKIAREERMLDSEPGEPRADPQSRARDQEPARRHPRRGAAARPRARAARRCTSTRRSS